MPAGKVESHEDCKTKCNNTQDFSFAANQDGKLVYLARKCQGYSFRLADKTCSLMLMEKSTNNQGEMLVKAADAGVVSGLLQCPGALVP